MNLYNKPFTQRPMTTSKFNSGSRVIHTLGSKTPIVIPRS